MVWLLSLSRRRATSLEGLTAIWLLVNYIGFSNMPSKGPAYMTYFALAACPLAVVGVHHAVMRRLPRIAQAIGWAGILTLAILQGVNADIRSSGIAGFDVVATSVLETEPAARVLYNGHCGPTFVFYLRGADRQRAAAAETIYSMADEKIDRLEQYDLVITEPPDFLDHFKPDSSQSARFRRWRSQILAAAASGTLLHLQTHCCTLYLRGTEIPLVVQVYARRK